MSISEELASSGRVALPTQWAGQVMKGKWRTDMQEEISRGGEWEMARYDLRNEKQILDARALDHVNYMVWSKGYAVVPVLLLWRA